jgi:hypothetical protein
MRSITPFSFFLARFLAARRRNCEEAGMIKNEESLPSPSLIPVFPGAVWWPYGALHLLGGFAAPNVTTFLTFPETV